MERSRTVSFGNDPPPANAPLMAYDPPQGHNDGDLSTQHMDSPYSSSSPYSNVDTSYTHDPPVMSPEIMDSKGGAYTYLNTPTSTFDVEDGHHHHHHLHHHVKRFDHNESRKKLFKTGAVKLLITLFFSAAICVCLKSWEGFRGAVVLSNKDVRIFNAVLLGLSLCLGLNILSSLKHYAATFRWSFLTRRYVSLEVFDLILHLSSLAKVTKLMFISAPGFRGSKFLRRFKLFKDVRDDGTKWMWLACFVWLSINIGSQILVALLSLFWPMSNSDFPLMTHGSVNVANLNNWYLEPDGQVAPETDSMANETSLEAAWMFGMEAMVYPELPVAELRNDLSSLPGTPLYKADGSFQYRFYNRDPAHQYTNYLASSRNVSAITTCTQLETKGNGSVIEEGPEYEEFGSWFIDGKEPGKDWDRYAVPERVAGAITWIGSVQAFCGPRCTNFTVLQYGFDDRVKPTSLFLCNSTLANVTEANHKDDITGLTDADKSAVYGNDDFARIAAGAIGWTGIPWNNWLDRQSRSYSQGSKWSPARVVTKTDVEEMLMRFTIGAVAAFDDHGIRYNVSNQRVVPTQGQQLDVDWSYIFSILGGICGIQFFALCLLVVFANRTIVRDDSYFSMAMLLSPVVERIGKMGMNMKGDEIKDHPKLKWKKIRYDYREGKNGEPNQVDIFFEGKDQKEGRKSWAPGSYS